MFLWCHVRHINQVKIHPEITIREGKNIFNSVNYNEIEFPVREKDFSKIGKKNNICINTFWYENKMIFRIYTSDQKFETSMDLLLVIHENKAHYVYNKDFYRFMFRKTKNKNKKTFAKVVYSVASQFNRL